MMQVISYLRPLEVILAATLPSLRAKRGNPEVTGANLGRFAWLAMTEWCV